VKPVGLLDLGGYWAPLAAWLDHAVAQRFLRAEQRAMLLSEPEPGALLDALAAWQPATVQKWLDREER
jgi:predicted Rossmann-fold nucleotide-binding protein